MIANPVAHEPATLHAMALLEVSMLRYLKNLTLTAALLSAVMLVPMSAHGLQMPDFSEAERQYAKTVDQRGDLIGRLRSVESDYRRLVAQIDHLKANDAISTIGGRIELQNLLTRSKALADQLDRIQNEVRALDNRLQGQRSTLVTGIDRRVRELERSLGSVAPASRSAIVEELNTLRKRRSGLATPLPSAPSATEVRGALRLASEVGDHPDELMAAADELQDTEDQLRRRLAAINGQLQDLRDEKALVRRAQSFAREERFFEETDRDRVIARFERETTVRTSTPNSDATDNSANETPPVANEETVSGNSGNNANNDFAASDGLTASPQAAAGDDFGEASRGGSSMTDAPGSAEVAPPAPSTRDPFQTTRETIVIGGGSDPARSVGSLSASGRNVDGQITTLEKERKKLEKQAEELEKRAADLRRRARQL